MLKQHKVVEEDRPSPRWRWVQPKITDKGLAAYVLRDWIVNTRIEREWREVRFKHGN